MSIQKLLREEIESEFKQDYTWRRRVQSRSRWYHQVDGSSDRDGEERSRSSRQN